MSVVTPSDERLAKARDAIAFAMAEVGHVLIDLETGECWPADNTSPERLERLAKAFEDLRRIKGEL